MQYLYKYNNLQQLTIQRYYQFKSLLPSKKKKKNAKMHATFDFNTTLLYTPIQTNLCNCMLFKRPHANFKLKVFFIYICINIGYIYTYSFFFIFIYKYKRIHIYIVYIIFIINL
jgi:hypothetical protein